MPFSRYINLVGGYSDRLRGSVGEESYKLNSYFFPFSSHLPLGSDGWDFRCRVWLGRHGCSLVFDPLPGT